MKTTDIFLFITTQFRNMVITTISLSLIFSSCKKDESELKEIEIDKSGVLNLDSIVLSDYVTEIVSNNNNLVIFDEKAKRYYIKNLETDSIKVFTYGKGPGEITSCYSAAVLNDKTHIADFGRNTISVYNKNGQFFYDIANPVNDVLMFSLGVDNTENYYISSFTRGKPIIKFNKTGVIKEFGEFLPSIDDREKRAINYRHLISSKYNSIISVYVSNPIIEVFSFDGEKLFSYDLSKYFTFFLDLVKKSYQESPQNRYITHNLFLGRL